jgi:two-component system cell cycle response regulator
MTGRVLVIEDNEENLTLADYLLCAHGFETLLARTGADGLELATASRLDLILLDVRMPFMDGYEVARAIRSHRALDPVPIVAVTASAMVGDRERIAQAGFDHYVQKPIDPEGFIAEIERCLLAGSAVTRIRSR